MSERSDADDVQVEPAEIVREYGPFSGAATIHGVSHDGERVWFAASNQLHALDPASGQVVRVLDAAGDAGTAFDGKHLFQIANGRIHKIDPETGRVIASIPAPGNGGMGSDAGLAWADGSLWVGQYHARTIYQIDPETGAIRRAIESNRFAARTQALGIDMRRERHGARRLSSMQRVSECVHGRRGRAEAVSAMQLDRLPAESLRQPKENRYGTTHHNTSDVAVCGRMRIWRDGQSRPRIRTVDRYPVWLRGRLPQSTGPEHGQRSRERGERGR